MSKSLNYRPWGRFDWLLSNLPKFSYHFIGCVGTEDRCVAAYQEAAKLKQLSGCSFVEVLDTVSVYSPTALKKRQANYSKLQSFGVSSSDVTQVNLLAKEEEIVVWIEKSIENASTVLIDISSLPKRFFFPAIRLLLKQDAIKNLLVTYTVPETYCSENIAELPSDWRALPLFGPEEYPEPQYEIAAIGVGFLPFGLPDLLKSGFRGAKPHLLFPFPASPSTYFKTWEFVRQIETSLPLNPNDQIVRINGMDPSDTFDHICWLTEQNTKKALFAPYGPKPMSLGMAIYATLTESPVYYTQPRVYHPDYSTGVRIKDGRPEIFTYCLKLEGRNLYSV